MKTPWAQTSAAAVLVLGLMPQLAAACVAVYGDHNVDTTQGEVQAWVWVEDCDDMGATNPPYFEHQYYASVHIDSPTQNSAGDNDIAGPIAYAGGSADAYASISYDGDLGGYDIEFEVSILCSLLGQILSGVEEEDDVPAPGDCTANGVDSVAIATMAPWSPLAYERGGTILCLGSVAIPNYFMDSFEEIFSGVYYSPTDDPCELALISAGAYAGFHSHPRFSHESQLNRGETCHGEGPYDLQPFQIASINQQNVNFQGDSIGSTQGGDFLWPPNTNSPLYMLTPNANVVKILDTNLQVDEVWP